MATRNKTPEAKMKITMEHLETLEMLAEMSGEYAAEDGDREDQEKFDRAAKALRELLKPDMTETTKGLLDMLADHEG
jgi:hypothetical protein